MVLQNVPLEVTGVHLYPMENALEHHTENFELVHLEPATPILRRGQPFKLQLRLQGRAYEEERDSVRLVFNFGSNPSVMKGTRGIALLTSNPKPKDNLQQWTAAVKEQEGESLVVEICSPADAPVGIWDLRVRTMLKNDSSTADRVHKHEGEVYLLFNPWLPAQPFGLREDARGVPPRAGHRGALRRGPSRRVRRDQLPQLITTAEFVLNQRAALSY